MIILFRPSQLFSPFLIFVLPLIFFSLSEKHIYPCLTHEVVQPVVHAGQHVDRLLHVTESQADARMLLYVYSMQIDNQTCMPRVRLGGLKILINSN